MKFSLLLPASAALVTGLVATTVHAEDAQRQPWDDPIPVAPKAAKAPVASATTKPANKPTNAPRTARPKPKAGAEATGANGPFGAPVDAQAAGVRWGEPIALTPEAPAGAAANAPGSAAAGIAAQAQPVSGESAAKGPWVLLRGVALHTQLQKWARAAGWQLEWKLNRSWVVPADVNLAGTFDQAVEQVIQALANEGKPVNLIIWEGNRVAEVNETAPR